MEKFWIVTLFHFSPDEETRLRIEQKSMDQFSALGIEEFSLTEAQVDEILGDRAYSGGDVPETVLDEVEETVLSQPAHYRFFFDSNENAQSFKSFCEKEILAELQLEEQNSQDWNAEWKKHYAPILVNDQFEVIPSWMQDYKSKAKNSLFINPGMGFGTGSHETTFLCLRLLTEATQNKMASILDFGSGSGILGLASFKFFPDAEIDFYDIDPEANKNCFQNAELNGLENMSFRLVLPEVRHVLKDEYDLVFANILESILLLEQKYLVSVTRPGGLLILSGLLNHQVKGIVQTYEALGMKLINHLSKGDWSALSFKRDSV